MAGKPNARVVRRLVAGIELDDGIAKARRAKLIQATPDQGLIELVMTEGRNREIRRMMALLGHPGAAPRQDGHRPADRPKAGGRGVAATRHPGGGRPLQGRRNPATKLVTFPGGPSLLRSRSAR